MDAEDKTRTLSNGEKIRRYLREHGSASNHRLRGIGGSRAMARVWEWKRELEAETPQRHTLTIRKIKGSEWEIRFDRVPLGRDAGTPAPQKPLPMTLF